MGEEAHFHWRTEWETDATSGFIVQEIYTVMNTTDCRSGRSHTDYSRYWEAWQLDGRNSFVNNGYDIWSILVGRGRGDWSKTGEAYWVSTLDSEARFTPRGAREAGILLSTYTQPRSLGPILCRRNVRGVWDACGSSIFECFHRLTSPALAPGSTPRPSPRSVPHPAHRAHR